MSTVYHTKVLETFVLNERPQRVFYHMYTTDQPPEAELSAFETYVRSLYIHQGIRKNDVTVQVQPPIRLESPSEWEVQSSVHGFWEVF